MTVNASTRRSGPYSGTGLIVAYPFNFKIFAAADLLVVRAVVATGATTDLLLDSDYSVTLNPDQEASPGGNVFYAVGGVPTALPIGFTLTIAGNLPFTQPTDLTNLGGFYPEVIEDALDREVMLIQQSNDAVDRALLLNVATNQAFNTQLPAPVPTSLFGWAPDGLSIVNYAVGIYADVAALIGALASAVGSTMVGWVQSGTGAVLRTIRDKLRERISALDFGADPTGVVDATAATNFGTRAVDAYSASLYRCVDVIGGTYKVGGGNLSIYVRKGQSLIGAGMGATRLDASATSANTTPTVVLGKSSGGVTDGGGQPAVVAAVQFLGGPSAFANIDTTACAGWAIYDVMLSSPGVGITVGGADGLLHDCLFDEGLNQVVVTGANHLISDCNYYLGNFQLTFAGGCYDVSVDGCQFEYAQFSSILFGVGGVGPVNINIRNSNFIANVQYGTYQGAIFSASNNSNFKISNCTARNLPGAFFKYSTGVGVVGTIESCVLDGLKTTAAYAQSTTMQGIDATNVTMTIRSCTLRNLPGQPITIGGGEIVFVVIEGVDFRGNTGGAAEILITNNNPASRIYIKNCTGSGRPLVNEQSTVPVIYLGNSTGASDEIQFVTAATFTVLAAHDSIVCDRAGTVTLTLPPANVWKYRKLGVRTVQNQTVVSAASNVVPLVGGAVGTAILAATAGKWAILESDGTNWIINQGN